VRADNVEGNDIAICASPLPSSHSRIRKRRITEMTTTTIMATKE